MDGHATERGTAPIARKQSTGSTTLICVRQQAVQRSLALLPELCVLERADLMNNVVAAARKAGALSRLDVSEKIRSLVMGGGLFEAPRTQVTMQAFPVVERLIQL